MTRVVLSRLWHTGEPIMSSIGVFEEKLSANARGGDGFNEYTYECIVSGIVTSIQKDHKNLAPGNIYLNQGDIADCGRNRSLGAYLNNPQSERDNMPILTLIRGCCF